jgi:competence protein ComEC
MKMKKKTFILVIACTAAVFSLLGAVGYASLGVHGAPAGSAAPGPTIHYETNSPASNPFPVAIPTIKLPTLPPAQTLPAFSHTIRPDATPFFLTAPAATPNGNEGITVYITKTGAKYHSKGCQYLKNSCIPVTLAEAKEQGYTPCSKCRPPR